VGLVLGVVYVGLFVFIHLFTVTSLTFEGMVSFWTNPRIGGLSFGRCASAAALLLIGFCVVEWWRRRSAGLRPAEHGVHLVGPLLLIALVVYLSRAERAMQALIGGP
jgi:hypothetical protein